VLEDAGTQVQPDAKKALQDAVSVCVCMAQLVLIVISGTWLIKVGGRGESTTGITYLLTYLLTYCMKQNPS